jgi:hypothetical protein
MSVPAKPGAVPRAFEDRLGSARNAQRSMCRTPAPAWDCVRLGVSVGQVDAVGEDVRV